MKRRTFLKSAATAGLGSVAMVGMGIQYPGRGEVRKTETRTSTLHRDTLENIGLQLYTIRSLMGEDFEGTLERVAAIGYSEVEFAGYFGRPAADVRALLDKLDMKAPAVHVGIDMLRQDLTGVLDAAEIIGHQYVVCPWLAEDERSLDHYRQHAALFNEVGAACQEAGMQFAYHNHDFEFFAIEEQVPYDLLLAETDPNLVQMELDLYWIEKSGHSALTYFGEHPGRFPLCHVKDMAEDESITTVGNGVIDFGPMFAASEQAGLVHYFVEHDFPEDPMRTIVEGFEYLSTLQF